MSGAARYAKKKVIWSSVVDFRVNKNSFFFMKELSPQSLGLEKVPAKDIEGKISLSIL